MTPEGDLVKSCLDYLAAKRIFAFRINTTGVFDPSKQIFRKFTGMKGVSDILGILPNGKFMSLECKIKPNKPTEDQDLFMDNVTDNGGVALLVYSIDELDSDIQELLR